MKRTRIKICGFTRTEDLQSAVDAGVDAVGLVFAQNSKRYRSTDQALELVRQVPAFVSCVGLFVDPEVKFVQETLARLPLGLLQFHGQEDNDFCRSFGRPFIKAVSVNSSESVNQAVRLFPDAAGLLLDSHGIGQMGGTGKVFPWEYIPENCTKPLLLAGGLSPGNVAEAIRRVHPFAVDVSSGVETGPGIKDADLIRAFISEVNSVDHDGE